MKRYVAIVVCTAVFFLARRASTCGPCGSGVDCQHIADICRQDLFLDEYNCIAAACATQCASLLSVISACPVNPQPIPYVDACTECMVAPAPMGCATELSACGLDDTGGISCASWLGGGDGADITPCSSWNATHDVCLDPYAALDAESALGACVCGGACGPAAAGPCSSACADVGYGYYYAPTSATNGCKNCVKKQCGPQLSSCLAL